MYTQKNTPRTLLAATLSFYCYTNFLIQKSNSSVTTVLNDLINDSCNIYAGTQFGKCSFSRVGTLACYAFRENTCAELDYTVRTDFRKLPKLIICV